MKIKTLILMVCLLAISLANAQRIEKPDVHVSIMLDGIYFSDTEEQNTEKNRYEVREAAIELEGYVSEKVSYNIEAGSATCAAASSGFNLLSAGLTYEFNDNISLSFKQGHLLRGFAGSTDCVDRIAMERPKFFTNYAQCHPTGLVANMNYDLPMDSDIEFEMAFMNGVKNSFDGEHDYNFATIYNTPIAGLAITGVVNHVGYEHFNNSSNKFEDKNSVRYITGLKYNINGFEICGEFYTGKGWNGDDDLRYDAYYAIASQRIDLDFTEQLQYFQPYVRYECANPKANLDLDTEETYIDLGFILSLDKTTKLKMNWYKNLEKAEGQLNIPTEMTARIQISI